MRMDKIQDFITDILTKEHKNRAQSYPEKTSKSTNYCIALSQIPSTSSSGLILSTIPSAVVGFLYPSNSSIFGLISRTLLRGIARNWFSSVRRWPLLKNKLCIVRTESGTELCPPPWYAEARKIRAEPGDISVSSGLCSIYPWGKKDLPAKQTSSEFAHRSSSHL